MKTLSTAVAALVLVSSASVFAKPAPAPQPAVQPAQGQRVASADAPGLTRQQVRDELVAAQKSGELDRLNDLYRGS
ncbi:DUF4148 domain-containing protein [Burkholderia perseverans]|uniref:DUF4148 domain-containing protein n=1 Tax=Burkholderia perseverans TaxID=2615214 RepID=UPI001FEFA787|nr:DUF4148 domain-containing protein [Burkholderia perseverans]